ncbi:MAG: capsular biosynthesis protein [Succinimonas sp.]|nr:capsular biosynthesis protein [Succinimonas sp.]
MPNEKRVFLFLEGPLSPFFRELGRILEQEGCEVHRINFCGGDVFYWPSGNTHWWRGHVYEWPLWISNLMKQYQVTDLVLIGDWRPLHREAIWLARHQGNRIWVYEEGYLRPGYLTLEEDGVNAYSTLPRTPEDVHERARHISDAKLPPPSQAPDPMIDRVLKTAWHHVGNVLLWPFFSRYRTHRPYNIGRELTGHIPRYLNRHKRRRHGIEVARAILSSKTPFYLMPLQLDADSQVRRHSPFTGMLECMAMVITDFAKNAPQDAFLFFKNHPLDNGLRNYRRYMRSLGRATGCSDRLRFVEEIKAGPLINKARGIILCNSTIGLTALRQNKPVYCLGECIYAMPGLAADKSQMSLADFWTALPRPNERLLNEFIKVLKHDALVPGNFYSPEGIHDAIVASLLRMGVIKGKNETAIEMAVEPKAWVKEVRPAETDDTTAAEKGAFENRPSENSPLESNEMPPEGSENPPDATAANEPDKELQKEPDPAGELPEETELPENVESGISAASETPANEGNEGENEEEKDNAGDNAAEDAAVPPAGNSTENKETLNEQ